MGKYCRIWIPFFFIALFSFRRILHKTQSRVESALDGKNDKRQRQRIVILAGPHKTASSSIQGNFYSWTSIEPKKIKEWAWPVPPEVEEYCIEEREFMHYKGFIPLIMALLEGKLHNPIFDEYDCKEVISFYKKEFERVWRDSYNLVIGTESLDNLFSHSYKGQKVLNKLLRVLPLKKNKDPDDEIENEEESWKAAESDLTVVVNYRAPRIDHLISLWHQCCAKDGVTFKKFLTSNVDRNSDRLHPLNSIGLANVFLKRGLKTVLVDLSGVLDKGYDVSNVMACDILGEDCTDSKQLISAQGEAPKLKNVFQGNYTMGGITDEQLHRMDTVLRKHDCNFQHVLENENLKILYPFELDHIMAECVEEEKSADYLKNHDKLAEELINIAKD